MGAKEIHDRDRDRAGSFAANRAMSGERVSAWKRDWDWDGGGSRAGLACGGAFRMAMVGS